jgi:lipopolysaccharide export system protein LptA
MRVFSRVNVRLLITAALLALPSATLHAQQPAAKGPPNALQGFSQNRDQPVHIEAATLVVKDKEKVATFSGDVKVVQGDTTMKSKSLVVFYEQDSEAEKASAAAKPAAKPAAKSMQAAQPGPGGEQKIKRLEARGDVVVIQKDQTATGELGIFDMKTNTVTMTNNVVMTQGQNVLRGEKLIVDLTSGVSRVESGKNGQGRVQGHFLPGSAGTGAMPGNPMAPATTPAPAPAPAAPPRPAPPVRPF